MRAYFGPRRFIQNYPHHGRKCHDSPYWREDKVAAPVSSTRFVAPWLTPASSPAQGRYFCDAKSGGLRSKVRNGWVCLGNRHAALSTRNSSKVAAMPLRPPLRVVFHRGSGALGGCGARARELEKGRGSLMSAARKEVLIVRPASAWGCRCVGASRFAASSNECEDGGPANGRTAHINCG